MKRPAACLCVLLALAAFCARAEGLRLPSGVSCVETDMFRDDLSLRTAELPEGVERIEEGAFCGCAALEEIRFPSSLVYIADTAFSGCGKLKAAFAPAYSYACEWALSRGLAVRDAETGKDLTAFSFDRALSNIRCAESARQIVLVTYTRNSAALVTLHEKRGGMWEKVGRGDAVVGRNGIGKERDGDGRTPSGEFRLSTPFGIREDPGSAMPYTGLTPYHYWCAVSGDMYFNRLVDERAAGRARTAKDESLFEKSPYYDYAMFVEYNMQDEAGKGSCIFLHCKGYPDCTSGCIAVNRAFMVDIIRWAREGTMIVIR